MLKHFKLDTMTHPIKYSISRQHFRIILSNQKPGSCARHWWSRLSSSWWRSFNRPGAFCFQRKEKGNNTWSSEMKLNWHKLPICIGTNLKVPNIWWVHPASLFLAGFQSCFGNVSEIPAYKVLQYVFQGKTTLYRTLLIHHVHQCSPWFTMPIKLVFPDDTWQCSFQSRSQPHIPKFPKPLLQFCDGSL